MGKRDVIVPILAAWALLAVALACSRLPEPWVYVGFGVLALVATWATAGLAMSRQARLARLSRAARRLVRAEAGGADRGPEHPLPSHSPALDVLEESLSELDARVRRQVKDLAKQSRNLMSLIDSLDSPVLATGGDNAVLLCNRAAQDLLGLPADKLIGRDVRLLFTRREVLEMHERARAGEVRRGQVRLTTPGGSRTFQVSATPLPAAWGEGVFGAILVMRDVTELAQAVTVKTDFVANASHELRTPVAALKAAVETLLDGADDEPAMRRRMLEVCGKHILRLEEMVRDLMDLSRLESPDMPVNIGEVDLRDLVEAMHLSFEPACKQRSLRLEFSVEPGLDTMRGDPKLLGLILRNLIDNATKYAYENTAIVIRITRVDGEGGPMLRLEVTDRGVGIPLAQQERVFERFYQVDPARTGVTSKRGTGLGLAIVKHATKALGGRVGLTSVWGEGTTVWAETPIAPEPSGDQDAQGVAADDDRPLLP